MPLETFTDPNARLNIKGLSLDTPETESRIHFDPTRDLAPENWSLMEHRLDLLTRMDDMEGYVELLANITLFDRTKLPTIPNWMWQRIQEKFINLERDRGREYMSMAAAIVQIDRRKLPVIDKERWAFADELLKDALGQEHWHDYADLAADISFVDKAKLPELSDEKNDKMLSLCTDDGTNDWWMVAHLYRIAVLDPEKLPELSEDDWARFRNFFEKTKDGRFSAFPRAAAYLTTISRAEQSRLQNAMLVGETPPLPQVRKF